MASSRLDYGDEQMEKRSFTAQLNKPSTTKKSNYGSLRKELSTTQTVSAFIVNYKHRLMPGETLQGISLKYGVPMENIKRANRLWSNDLAFVKDLLIIPIDREKLKEMNLIEEEEPKPLDLNSVDVSTKTPAAAAAKSSDEAEDKEAYKDFLNKFDSFINESKLKLKSLESNSNLAANDYLNNGYHNYADDEDDTDLFDVGKRRHNSKEIDCDPNEPLVGKSSSSRTRKNNNNNNGGTSITSSASSVVSNDQQASNRVLKSGNASNSNSFNNLASLPDMIVKSPNSSIHSNTSGGTGQSGGHKYMSLNTNSSSRARLAQETLERLEKEKDDLFEL